KSVVLLLKQIDLWGKKNRIKVRPISLLNIIQTLFFEFHGNTMKFFYLLAICALSLAAIVTADSKQPPKFQFTPPERNLPTVVGGGGGSRKNGFDVSIDARQKVWESQNKRHSFDVTGGYSQHLGGRYGSGPADKRIGGIYKYRF
ncbi:hypothetical protein DOY81_004189, partial [Sarcophaga bullata]